MVKDKTNRSNASVALSIPLPLSVQVVVLVVLPLILQWGVLVWLLNLQVETERALERCAHARDVSEALGRLRTDMYQVIRLAGAEAVTGAAQGAARARIRVMVADYESLSLLTAKDDPLLKKVIENSKAELRQALGAMIKIKVSIDQDPHLMAERGPLWAEAQKHLFNVLNHDFSKIGEEEASQASLGAGIEADYRQKQLLLLIGLALTTLALAIVSAVYLTRGISLRLAKVSDNAYRLASDRPLNPVLLGNDEIAQLDRTFHGMAKILKDSENLKQEVVLMVTHDLRTPLATLENILKFLRSGNFGRLDQKGAEYVMVANRNVERMSNLVNDLLDIEKVKSGLMTLDKQDFDLVDCFTAANELSGAFAEEARVKILTIKTDLLVLADQDKVTRVLANLIANAVRFSPAGGTVTLAARLDGPWVYTTVDDQGAGLDSDQLGHLFERFRPVDADGGKVKVGSGLGLTICQAIIELHGGKIWAENLPKGGSRFTFTLPAA